MSFRFHPSAEKELSEAIAYGVLYTDEGDEILIVAVMHLHREPGYWNDRM